MGSLANRLARFKEQRERAAAENERSVPPQDPVTAPSAGLSAAGPPAGWERLSRHLWARRVRFSDTLPERFSGSLLLPRQCRREQLLFLDTETSGLSGGAGTVVFLAGIGRVDESGFSVEQLFLTDFPGERDFLEAVRDRVPSEALCVTYNGRTFDLPLLRGRFAMQRIRFAAGPQVDLLHPSRTLWASRIGSCTLGNIEASVLGISRTNDLPGREVPDRWFGFLDSGDPRPLAPVFEHNLQDVRTLLFLLARLESCFASPDRAEGIDRFGLGVMLARAGRTEAAELLAAAWREGDARAGRLLALRARRAGLWNEACAIWDALYRDGRSRTAGTELAKYFEHRAREPEKALQIVREMLRAPLPDRARRDLEYRLHRLARKTRRSGKGSLAGGNRRRHRERG